MIFDFLFRKRKDTPPTLDALYFRLWNRESRFDDMMKIDEKLKYRCGAAWEEIVGREQRMIKDAQADVDERLTDIRKRVEKFREEVSHD